MPGQSALKNEKGLYLTADNTFSKAESKALVYPSARQANIAKGDRADGKSLKTVAAPEKAVKVLEAAAKKAAKADGKTAKATKATKAPKTSKKAVATA